MSHKAGNVIFSTQTHYFNTGANSTLRALGSQINNEEIKQQKLDKINKQIDQQIAKEARCKLTDEQVRVLRRAHEKDGWSAQDVFREFGTRYNITKAYVYSLLTYQTRSKVLI